MTALTKLYGISLGELRRHTLLARRAALAQFGLSSFVLIDSNGYAAVRRSDGKKLPFPTHTLKAFGRVPLSIAEEAGASFVVRFKAYKPEFLARVSLNEFLASPEPFPTPEQAKGISGDDFDSMLMW